MGIRKKLGKSVNSVRKALSDSTIAHNPMGRSFTFSKAEGTFSDYEDAYLNDEIVRQSINLLAYFGTQKGFTVKLKSVKDDVNTKNHQDVREKTEKILDKLKLDEKLLMAEINRKIYGRAAFEIVYDNKGFPDRLIPLPSKKVKPVLNDNWELKGYRYTGQKNVELVPDDHEIDYPPKKILYIPNDPLDAHKEGNSAIAPVMKTLETKDKLRDDMKKAAERLWAPVNVFQMNFDEYEEELSDDEKEEEMENFVNMLEAGEQIVTNESIDVTTTKLNPNLEAFVNVLEKLDQEILGNFGIPKALMARGKTTNRATLEYALKAMYEGPIASIQRAQKTELERQLYDRIVENMNRSDKVKVVHEWNPVSLIDFMNMAEPLSTLKESGIVDTPKAWEVMGWDTDEIESTSYGSKVDYKVETNVADIKNEQMSDEDELVKKVQEEMLKQKRENDEEE